MHYLQNPHQPELSLQIKAWLMQPDHEEKHVLWLFDGAFLTQSEHAQLQRLLPDMVPLFQGTPLAEYGPFGPHGYFMSPEARPRAVAVLDEVLALTSGKPALSMMRLKTMPAPAVWPWLASLSVEDDAQHYVLRFADTHQLPYVLTQLKSKQWQTNTAFIEAVVWVDRQGALAQQALMPLGQVAPSFTQPLVISQACFAALLAASDIDMTYAALTTLGIDVAQASPYETHQYLHFLWRKMAELHIETHQEKIQFIGVMGPAGGQIFKQVTDLLADWDMIKDQVLTFKQASASWPDEIWQQISVLKIKSKQHA